MKRSHLSLIYNLKYSNKSQHHRLFTTNHQLHTLHSNELLRVKDTITFANALTLSSTLNSLLLGYQVHAQIIKSGFSTDTFSQNNLIVMYSKCGALEYSFKVFDEMPERNLVSWTSLISGLIRNEEFRMGMEVFVDMLRYGCQPNEFTLGSVLRGCASIEAIEFGKCVHCFALKVGFTSNCYVGSSILHMYAKCGDIEEAEMIFESMDDHDVGCWNAMIGGYALNGYSLKALELAAMMCEKGVVMDHFTFMSVVKGCSLLGDFSLGRQIHGMIIRGNVAFGTSGMNALIDMYIKIGWKQYGLKVFDNMYNKDVISWNTVFSGFIQDGNAREAVRFFSNMLLTGAKPNHVTFLNLFRQCGESLDVYLCFQLHSPVVRLGFLSVPVVANSVIDAYSCCGALEIAKSVLDSLPVKDITTWNEMILGYKLNGCTTEALKLFSRLRKLPGEANEFTFSMILGASLEGQHHICEQVHGTIIRSGFGFNSFVSNSLLNAYAKCGHFDDCLKIFNEIERLDLATWSALVSAFVLGGRSYEALLILNQLIEVGEKPDEFILGSVLNGCANIAAYQQTRCIHSIVIQSGFEKHVCVASAVIDAYAKCGDVEGSRRAFDCSLENGDVIVYNTMIMAYAHHGLVVEAIEILKKMKLANLQPTNATFVAVISLCSHMGLVELGSQFFSSISLVYKIVPSAEIYGSLVDMFSRNGFLEEAKSVLEAMPFEPWPAVWRSLLNGCRIHGNRMMGEWAHKRLLQLVPENDAAYFLLTKVYSQEGNWDESAKMGMRMLEQGVQKEPGYSWIGV